MTVPAPDTIEPWERQPSEPPKAFAAFATYRDMPPHARSLARVAELLGRQTGVNSASKRRRAGGQLYEWSRLHEWVARAEAWDRHKDQEARAAQVEAVRDVNKNHGLAVRGVFNLLVKRLGAMQPAELSAGETLRLLKETILLERLVLGQPVAIERVEHGVAGETGPARTGGFAQHLRFDPSQAEVAEVIAMMAERGMITETDDPLTETKTEETTS